MPKKKLKNRRLARLADRDFEIFEHIARYRLTTHEFLHKLFFEEDGSQRNAVSKVTSRLTRRRFLNRWNLYGSNKYFVLGPKAIGYVSVSKRRIAELGVQALPHEFATLAFCLRSDVPRKRLKVSELSKNPQELLHKGVDSAHYFMEESDGVKALGHLLVDQGGTPSHVARKCAAQLEIREKLPAFRQLIHSGHFLLAVATGSEAKRQDIIRTLKNSPWPVQFRVEVVPELVYLVGALQGE